jgi:uncharacterized protein (DUF1697 family)
MKSYVCLLRGINVGGKAKVDMASLKIIFEQSGYQQVTTTINSGNVLFVSDQKVSEIKATVEDAILAHFGLSISVFVRDAQNIAELCRRFPKEWTNDDNQKTDILFLTDDVDKPETVNQIIHDPSIDTLIYCNGAIGWNVLRSNYNRSCMRKFIGTSIYKNMTARNINTLRKINDLLQDKK